jgi:hypothetical protein
MTQNTSPWGMRSLDKLLECPEDRRVGQVFGSLLYARAPFTHHQGRQNSIKLAYLENLPEPSDHLFSSVQLF